MRRRRTIDKFAMPRLTNNKQWCPCVTCGVTHTGVGTGWEYSSSSLGTITKHMGSTVGASTPKVSHMRTTLRTPHTVTDFFPSAANTLVWTDNASHLDS